MLDVALGAGGGPGYVEVMQGPAYTNRLYLFRGDLSVGNEDQFGRSIAIADLDKNGTGEIIVGAHVGDGDGLGPHAARLTKSSAVLIGVPG